MCFSTSIICLHANNTLSTLFTHKLQHKEFFDVFLFFSKNNYTWSHVFIKIFESQSFHTRQKTSAYWVCLGGRCGDFFSITSMYFIFLGFILSFSGSLKNSLAINTALFIIFIGTPWFFTWKHDTYMLSG